LAFASHRLFYATVIAMAGSGIVMALQTNLFDSVFAGRGQIPGDFWAFPMRSVHYALSRLLMGLIVLHVVAALYHAVILRDGLLKRMFFGQRLIKAKPILAAPEVRP
jgi:cytochrome b561